MTNLEREAWSHEEERRKMLASPDPVKQSMIEEVWSALGCAPNPDAFKPAIQQAMWREALSMITNATARDSRVYRENQELSAEIERLRSPEPQKHRKWGVFYEGYQANPVWMQNESRARFLQASHGGVLVSCTTPGRWTKEEGY